MRNATMVRDKKEALKLLGDTRVIQSWPGSTSAIRDIFAFFAVPFQSRQVGEYSVYSGVVGERTIDLTTIPGDENALVIEVMSPADEHAKHGVILQHCIKIDTVPQKGAGKRKSVKIYTFGGEIDLDDTWGIHVILR